MVALYYAIDYISLVLCEVFARKGFEGGYDSFLLPEMRNVKKEHIFSCLREIKSQYLLYSTARSFKVKTYPHFVYRAKPSPYPPPNPSQTTPAPTSHKYSQDT